MPKKPKRKYKYLLRIWAEEYDPMPEFIMSFENPVGTGDSIYLNIEDWDIYFSVDEVEHNAGDGAATLNLNPHKLWNPALFIKDGGETYRELYSHLLTLFTKQRKAGII